MGSSSVLPARKKQNEQQPLELVSYVNSVAPEIAFGDTTQSLIRERRADDRLTVTLLSGTAGYIDAVCFLTLVGLLPAHVTGELVGLTTALTANHHLSHASRLAVIPVFTLALVVAALVSRRSKQRGRSATRALLGLMAAALALSVASGCFAPFHRADGFDWLYALREASVMAAMAFQNAFTREGLAGACQTTVMTGNLTHLTFDLVELLAARLLPLRTEATHARHLSGSRLRLVASALGGFVGGALLGGVLTGLAGPLALVLPLGTTLLLFRRFG